MITGKIIKIAGPVIVGGDMKGTQMHEMVRVGEIGLIGEIIELEGDTATIQVYEETAGIRPGEKIESTGGPLSVELGPGILRSIYDGIQRPLDEIQAVSGDYLPRGVDVPSLDKDKEWEFVPTAQAGDKVGGGDIIGTVDETSAIVHKILIPPNVSGTIKSIVNKGKYTVVDDIAEVETENGIVKVQMMQVWPVRVGRPYEKKIRPGYTINYRTKSTRYFLLSCKRWNSSNARTFRFRKNCNTATISKMGKR